MLNDMVKGLGLGALIVWVLGACVKLPHVEPEPRGQIASLLAAVTVQVSCGGDTVIGWDENKTGSGLIISERHILTAQHVVACPTIPNVHVLYTTKDGLQRVKVYVTREDEGQDIARLEIASAEYFGFGLPPPLIGSARTHDFVCAWPGVGTRQAVCGVVSYDLTAIEHMDAVKGDSGAGVYSQGLDTYNGVYTEGEGELIGIVVRKGEGYTRIAPVDATWLEGT